MKTMMILNGYTPAPERYLAQMLTLFQSAGLTPDQCVLLCREKDEGEALSQHVPCNDILSLVREQYIPEPVLNALVDVVRDTDLCILGSDYASSELAARLATRCGGSACIGVTSLEMIGEEVSFWKRVYSNHMEARFTSKARPLFLSAAKSVLKAKLPEVPFAPTLRSVQLEQDKKAQVTISPVEGNCLEATKILVAGGNGSGGRDGLTCLYELAEALGGEFGASKPVAMNGWAPLDRLIGISGTIATPALCITAGVSGAAAFYAGVEKSEHILAINTDKDAPIMGMADVIVEGDYKKIVPALNEYIGAKK